MEKFGIIIEIAGGQIYGLLSKFFGFNVSLKKRGGISIFVVAEFLLIVHR